MKTKTQPTEKPSVAGSLVLLTSLFLLLTFYCPLILAQTNGKISGKVIANNGNPLPYASITLHKQDGQILKNTLSDTLGLFNFNQVAHGSYYIKITAMGFKAYQSKNVNLLSDNNHLNLGTLSLTEDFKILNAVTIKSQKKLIEQDIDKIVINIENSILSDGNTALELLEKSPGVKVDQDGGISLKGRPGVMVMINGKATYLSTKELSTLLKSTNSASISKIEIMSNPSAKYDASGNAGIINIQMKKNIKAGFNGNISLNGGASRNARYGSNINLNYRKNKLNLYSGYNYTYRGETEYLDFARRFYDSGIAAGQANRKSIQNTKTNEPLHTNNFRIGLEYDINNTNSIGFLINGNIGKYIHDSKTGNKLTNNSNSLISETATANFDRQN